MVTDWRHGCRETGVSVLYKYGRKLIGDRTTKSRLSMARVVEESQFADDIALYVATCDGFESVGRSFVETAGK